ncbi:MAG TPA: hypothetical protein VNO14_04705 [Blastocatellia bacterium]|nr:hypothetical protein [Blastocatellia bacterium]
MRTLLCVLVSMALAAACFAAQTKGRAYTPRPGTPERRAILDSVRSHLGIKNQFEVAHMKVNEGWAFFRGNALVFEQGEKLEVDSVMALLRQVDRGGKKTWQVESLWSLEKNSDQPMENFLEIFRRRQRDDRIPADIFPEDVMKP